jgi:Spy/CpxP family protein refolding chaperone
MGKSLELILDKQEELNLTQDQIGQFQGLMTIRDRDITPVVEEIQALREATRSGDVERDEAFRQMEALRGRLISGAAPLRGRIREILTVEQHRELQASARQARAGRGGPGAMKGPARRGVRGPGAGVGRGWTGSRGGVGRHIRPGRRGVNAAPGLGRGMRRNLPFRHPGAMRNFGRGLGGQAPLGREPDEGLPPGSF